MIGKYENEIKILKDQNEKHVEELKSMKNQKQDIEEESQKEIRRLNELLSKSVQDLSKSPETEVVQNDGVNLDELVR